MVDLPSIPNNVPEVRAPTPMVSPGDIAQPYQELAKTLGTVGDVLNKDVAVPLAEKAGMTAVTRDADGNVQVQKAPLFGDAADAYAHAVKVAALADGDGAARRDDLALREKFRDNPQGYLQAADQYRQAKIQQYTDAAGPEVGVALGRVIDSQTTQTYHGLLNEHERLTLQRTSASLVTGIQSASDDLTAMARGGVTSGSDWDAALAKYNTLSGERVNNPRLAYPQVQADFDREHLMGTLGANGFLYHVDQTYKNAPTKADGAKQALDYAQGILTDPSLKLTQDQREGYYHKAVGEIRANEALRKQDIGEARQAEYQLTTASALGVKVDPQQVDGIANMYRNAGDQAGAARLYASFARKPLNDDFGRQPIDQQTAQLAGVRGQAASKQAYDFFTSRGYTPAQASGIVGNLAHESGMNPALPGDNGTSAGLAQFHNERLTALKQFAAARNKQATDFQTQLEFIDNELHTTEGRSLTALKAAATPEDAAAAFVNYERPKGYDPNNLPASSGFDSRVSLAKQVFTGQGNVATGTPASALWLQTNRARTLDTTARTQWKTMWDDYEKEGIRPPDKVVNSVLDAARATGDHDLLETISAAGDRLAMVQDAAQRGLPAQQAQITAMHQLGGEGQLSPGQNGVLKDLERRYNAISTGLQENPIATTVANFGTRFPAPGPLNVSDPAQLADGLAYRAKIAQFAQQNWQTKPLAALDKADLASLSAALDNPDPAAKAAIFSAVNQLPEDIRNATLSKLGDKGPDQMVTAAAGMLQRAAPDIAESILRGQQAIKANKGYEPGKADEVSFTEDMNKLLPPSTFSLAGRTYPSGPMAIATGAIKARYADLSAKADDASGKYNPDRLRQAVTDVTGGVLEHNGGHLIAPQRGMSQHQFEGVMAGITDADLGHTGLGGSAVTTPGGEPVTANYLRDKAQLESVGSGRYLIRLGRDTDKPIYAFQGANSESPQPFILDLRGRQQAPLVNYPTTPDFVP